MAARRIISPQRRNASSLLVVLGLVLALACPFAARGHEIWIETGAATATGQQHDIHVCWGHAGVKETGERLAGQLSKLSSQVVGPVGRGKLELAAGEEDFTTQFTSTASGCYAVGAELQVGIIDKQMHSIPPQTRIVMYGKSVFRAGEVDDADPPALGHTLEIVPVAVAPSPRVGELVTVRILHEGRPIGGREVLVTAMTAGGQSATSDARVQSHVWSNEAMADPATGEATFPLIAGGRHFFVVRYTDETAGTYEGARNDVSDFSHLRKGDRYERTMFVSTLTLEVASQ